MIHVGRIRHATGAALEIQVSTRPIPCLCFLCRRPREWPSSSIMGTSGTNDSCRYPANATIFLPKFEMRTADLVVCHYSESRFIGRNANATVEPSQVRRLDDPSDTSRIAAVGIHALVISADPFDFLCWNQNSFCAS